MKLKLIFAAMAVAAMGAVPKGANDLPPELAAPRPVPAERAAPAPDPQATLEVIAASEAVPDDFLWARRPLVVFAATAEDPAFADQMALLRADAAALVARDVVVITDTDPQADSAWRARLHPGRGFSLLVIDKDGQVKLRKPFPWDVREITRAIDKFPLRRQEIGRAGLLP